MEGGSQVVLGGSVRLEGWMVWECLGCLEHAVAFFLR